MCLMTTDGRVRMAHSNIPVYKIIQNDNCSARYRFHYSPGKRYDLGFPLRCWAGKTDVRWKRVDMGFHAYRSLQTAQTVASEWRIDGFYTYKVVEFAVPLGAHYILGTHDEIVSDAIIARGLSAIYS